MVTNDQPVAGAYVRVAYELRPDRVWLLAVLFFVSRFVIAVTAAAVE